MKIGISAIFVILLLSPVIIAQNVERAEPEDNPSWLAKNFTSTTENAFVQVDNASLQDYNIILRVCDTVPQVEYIEEPLIFSKYRIKNRATMLGIGSISLYDSYLSPLKYKGIEATLLAESYRPLKLFNQDMRLQQQFKVEVALTDNPAKTSTEYFGNLDYRIDALFPMFHYDNFRFLLGGGVDLAIGGIYNVRNSNNPGSIKTNINLHLSMLSFFNFRSLTFRWQLSSPFVGVFFSPEYGHSYYEIFVLDNKSGTVHFGSFHNQFALRNYFTVDIPVDRLIFRVGYLGDFYKKDVNKLDAQISSHAFVLGLAFETIYLSGKNSKYHRYKSSFY